MVGDIAVFQHTPMATEINIGYTKCTGEENSRTFPQRRTSPLTRFSAKCLQAISASVDTPRRTFQLTVHNIIFLCRQATRRPSNGHFPSAVSSRVTCPAASSWSRCYFRGPAVHHQCRREKPQCEAGPAHQTGWSCPCCSGLISHRSRKRRRRERRRRSGATLTDKRSGEGKP